MYQWLDNNGYLSANQNTENEDNGILFSAYYFALANYAQWSSLFTKSPSNLLDQFAKSPNHLSHDNITAYLFFALKRNIPTKLKRGWLKKYLHPRDILFYLLINGKIKDSKFLKWSMKKTLDKKYDYRHKIQFETPESERSLLDKIKIRLCPIMPFLFKDKVKLFATSGKLLAWLRCEALGWQEFFNKQVEPDMLKFYFNNYFKDANHPINRILNES